MYQMEDLLAVMSRLRDPETGCPWDLKQTFASIAPYTLEETYELIDAIEQGDQAQIPGELGDVLFQVVFYSQLGKEQGAFDFAEVVHGITDKLLRRHPHVFPNGTLDEQREGEAPNEQEIWAKWEQIKQEERSEKALHSLMDDIPKALPGTSRASKMQKRASQIGFDWQNVSDVVAALRAELFELEAELHSNDKDALADEMGDVLFSAINLCRHLKLDAEAVLRAASNKFERRFRFVEQRAKEQGLVLDNTHNPQLDRFWTEAKQSGL
ncbi:nucleoside triphosphate pyrophosphohydrolase [Spongiibacter sp. KMU-158]|uniref:Nucleoside triphosphate pyrophosphohydrolase n=1 Tax=Spongiibacter pelagi TaxID=2760804 RepID=A0A927GW52_9GAMM|nr:nucleoside triphosphate pyrophosphohydrolase [Spongiibacter pelagi]MBD2858587.1 nucleoside triphosphate pyrophosphohydrolase [Spongiibacter pelagi]